MDVSIDRIAKLSRSEDKNLKYLSYELTCIAGIIIENINNATAIN
jgi:hypothetical protein